LIRALHPFTPATVAILALVGLALVVIVRGLFRDG
jgi:hypothetical protein